jgi:hypothetical protein
MEIHFYSQLTVRVDVSMRSGLVLASKSIMKLPRALAAATADADVCISTANTSRTDAYTDPFLKHCKGTVIDRITELSRI